MGKILPTIITRFDGGITNDPRDTAENVARVISNFDILTDPRRMIPYRSSESGASAPDTTQFQNFCIALGTAATYRLYALGVVSGTARAEVSMKDIGTGVSTTDFDDTGWASPANNQSSAGSTSFNLFAFYKKTGLVYGARAGTALWAFDPTGGAWADTSHSLSYTNISQGLVHSKDDILYVPYDNKIASNNNGSWTDAAFTAPSQYYISSIAENGNYLAITLTPLSGFGNSRVILWDRDTSLSTATENIDWGEGNVKILEEVDGVLIGISLSGGNTTRFNDRVIFRYLSGSQAIKFKELTAGNNSTILPIAKQKINNRLYFLMQVSLNGATREGVWSVGRTPTSPFTVVHERTPNNDTALAVSSNLYNFIIVGDFVFISYLSSSVFGLSKTDDSATYTATAIYESKKFNLGSSKVTKKLVGISVMTDYLPTAGQVVVKYRKDEETSFTTIFTNATDNSIFHSAINIESSGATLPEFKEIEFRIESTGGAVITGLQFSAEVIDKDGYQ